MALQLIYIVFSKLLSWMVLRTRSDTTKEIEILVLRHQLQVLELSLGLLRGSCGGPCGHLASPGVRGEE